MIWKTLVVGDDCQKANTMYESTTAAGIEEEGMMEMITIDLTEDIIAQVLEEVDSITRRRAMGEVAIITTTATVEEEGVETITMTIIPRRKDIVIDHLTITTSHHMDTIASTTIAVIGMRSIIESSTE